MNEYEQIAKEYCKKYGYNFIFADGYKIGIEIPDTHELLTLTWDEVKSHIERTK